MRKIMRFSIIEMMTVVVIVLLLLSLMVPTFVKLRMNARSAVCKNQMRQVGSLIQSYISDYAGRLPNDDANLPYSNDNGFSDIPKPNKGNSYLYGNWNGHLLPYLDIYLPDKYTRYAMLTKAACTRYDPNQLGGPVNLPPGDVLKNGWAVINDAFEKGGYNDLKAFICPEIHGSTIDVAASNTYNGVRIPRVSQFCHLGFYDKKGYDYGMGGGIPTTYLANDVFFGHNLSSVRSNSQRLDEITSVSSKAFLIEGGFTCGSNNAFARDAYYHLGSLPYEGYDLGNSHPGNCGSTISKTNPSFHKLSYVHDDYSKFWISDNGNMPRRDMPNYVEARLEIAMKFNVKYAGKAYMVPCTIDSSSYDPPYTIVSFIDPENGATFKDFLKENPNAGTDWGNFVEYSDEPNDFNYLVGSMNVLFGDGSVATKDQGWLSCNRRQIGMSQKE